MSKILKSAFTQLKEPGLGFFLELYTYGGHYHSTPEGMPHEIRMYGQQYKIYYHSRIYNTKNKKQRLRGVVFYAHRIIFIDPLQSIHMMKETLYHEVAHVYLNSWKTRIASISKLSYQQVEDLCDLFGEAIPDLVSNNNLR